MMLGISSGDRMLDPARINRQPGGSKRSSHFCNRLDSDGPAQSPVLIPGRPLGGPVVHQTTGSSASPFQTPQGSESYAFAVFQSVRPARPALRRPRDGQW